MNDAGRNKLPLRELTYPAAERPVKIRQKTFYRITCVGGLLRLSVLMQNREVMTGATEDNQRLWELGDVLEFFIQIAGHDDYYEFQLAPNGRTLKLHMPNDKIFRTIPFEKRFCQVPLKVRNVISARRGLVFSEIAVPLAGLEGGAEAKRIRCFVGRYDYTGGVREIAASVPMPDGGFHNTAAWPEFEFETEINTTRTDTSHE